MSDLRDLLLRDGFSARVRLANGVECIARRERGKGRQDQFVGTFWAAGGGFECEENICHVDSPYLNEQFWVGADVLDIRNPLQERVPMRICYVPPQHPPHVLALIDDVISGDPGEFGESR